MSRLHIFFATLTLTSFVAGLTSFRTDVSAAAPAGSVGPAAPMLEPRLGHSATLLPDGNVLIVRAADENRMADFCIATIQGAMLMGKIKRSSPTVETTIQEALAHLKSYLVKR